MRSHTTRLLLFIFACLAASSCKNSTGSLATGDLIPLKAGNQWIYQIQYTDNKGSLSNGALDTSKVGLSISFQGNEWSFFNFPNSTDILLFVNKIGGLWNLDLASEKSHLKFAFPGSVGEEYILSTTSEELIRRDSLGIEISDSLFTITKAKIISVSELVQCGSGTFTCYHYQVRDSLFDPFFIASAAAPTDFYISPNVGVIKIVVPSVRDNFNNIINTTYLLKEYRLK